MPAGGSMPHRGVRWCCASTSSPLLLTSRSRWMASWGMAHTGRSTRRSRTMAPVPLRRTATRPDRPRSRFIQLVRSTPPYASTPSWRTPARTTSGWGLMRRLGLSVWAPTMRNPSCGSCPAAVTHATRVPPRTTNQRPGSPGQVASSARRVKPASPSRAAAVAHAWYGDGEASQKPSRRRAASRSMAGAVTDRRAYCGCSAAGHSRPAGRTAPSTGRPAVPGSAVRVGVGAPTTARIGRWSTLSSTS